MTVDWGWAAGIAFVFAGAIAPLRMAGVILAGPLIQQAGRSYYERQLRGRRRRALTRACPHRTVEETGSSLCLTFCPNREAKPQHKSWFGSSATRGLCRRLSLVWLAPD